MFMRGWLSQKACIVAALLLVSVWTAWAYWPTLEHAPKHDQLAYLANVAGKTGLYSLTVGSYDLNRKSNIDLHLFRPLLYMFLGFEFWMFQYYFALWHVTGILLHLLVVGVLFGLLSKLRLGWMAFWGAAFFALMLTNVPMVNWEHINAYILFSLFVLLALKELFFYIEDDEPKERRCIFAVTLLSCSAFIFEAGALFSLVISLFFFIDSFQKIAFRRVAGWFLIPFVLYFLVSAVDLAVFHRSLSSEVGRMTLEAVSFQTVSYYIQTLKWFLFAGVFAGAADMSEMTRTSLSPDTLNWQWPLAVGTPHLFMGISLLILGAAFLILGGSRGLWKKRRMFLLIILGLITSYVLLLVLGRVNTRGVLVGLLYNSYYFYIFWMLVIVLFFAVIDWDKLVAMPVWGTLRWSGLVLVSGILFMNALSIRSVNFMVARDHRDARGLIRMIDGLVFLHKAEPGFSFYMAPGACPGDEIGEWFQSRQVPLETRYSLAQVLYPKYFRKDHPKYTISCEAK